MSNILTPKHFEAFGNIIYAYATIETGIKIMLSAIMQTPLHNTFVFCAPYSAAQLKNVIKSIAKDNLKPELSDKICTIAGEWSGFGGIRNEIAHCRWRAGVRDNSIRAVKYDVRSGRSRVMGFDADDKDYTINELIKICADMGALNVRLKKVFRESGLQEVADKIIERESLSIEASDGAESTAPSS